MDKPKKGRTIIIKINGKESLVKNKLREREQEERKEKMAAAEVNSVNLEAAAAKESEADGEDFEWVLPTGAKQTPDNKPINEQAADAQKEPLKKLPFMNGKGKKINPEKKKWLTTVFFIIACAVIVGTIFGMTILKMVSLEENSSVSGVPQTQQNEGKVPPPTGGGNEVQLPSLSAYVVQAAVYSSKETAELEGEKFSKDGLPAQVIDMSGLGLDGKYALFIGIASTLDGAKQLSEELSTRGIETFAKEVQIGGKTARGMNAEEKELLALAPKVFATISENIAAQKSSSLSEEKKASFAQLEKSIATIKQDNLKDDKVIQLYTAVKEAASMYKNYEKKTDEGAEKALQQHLLQILALYQEI